MKSQYWRLAELWKVSPEFSLALTITTIRHFFSRHSQINWALADQAMVSGVNFLTGILLARYLGVEEYGRFTLVWVPVLFVYSIQQSLIVAPMMSIGPKQVDKAAYFSSVFSQQICFALLSSLLVIVGFGITRIVAPRWNVSDLSLTVGFVLLTYQVQDFFRRYFFMREMPQFAFLNDFISYFGQLFLLWFLFERILFNTKIALLAIGATSMVAIFVSLFFVGPLTSLSKSFFDLGLFKRHWHFAKWLTGTSLVQWATGNIFFVVCGSLIGIGAVGILKAAQNILGVTHILVHGLDNVIPPKASELYHNQGIESLLGYIRKNCVYGCSVLGVFLFLVFLFPEMWLRFFYGAQFGGSGATVLRWYVFAYLLMFLGFLLRSLLLALELTKPIFMAQILSLLFSLAASYPFVFLGGVNGAAMGNVLVQIVTQVFLYYSAARYIKEARRG